MSINKEYLKKKVIEGIQKMPYVVDVYREKLNNYNECIGYELITQLTGVLYTDSKKSHEALLKDEGEIYSKSIKIFLVDYNMESIKVHKGDILKHNNNQFWKVLNPGEEFEIYFEMVVQENERIEA